MPLAFVRLTLLFSQLEEIETRDPPLLQTHKVEAAKIITERWFKSSRIAINELDVPDAVALLSSLLPERRTDRVYGIQAASLCRILCRALSLSAGRAKDLNAHKTPGRGGLAECVKRTLHAGGPPAAPPLTMGEVDRMLVALAAQCHFSDLSITSRAPPGSSEARDTLVGDVFKRVSPEEGKWLVRLILKDLAPVRIDEKLLLKSFHFLLPDLLRFQDDFEAALSLLKGPALRDYPEHPDRRSESLHRQTASTALRPRVGVKIGRPAFHKAWSMDSCLKMVGEQSWVIERKYDGEYCEVHIDLGKSPNAVECIKIFSKSGKDSTMDKQSLLHTLVTCLRLGRDDCKIKRQAILLGELVVYSDKDQCILPFDKIRKHVSRSGVFLGNERDSQPHAHEHLAIVFFDLFLLDEEIVMTKPVEERRRWLCEVYTKRRGYAMGAEWKIIDFADSSRSKKLLIEQFAASIAQRCEGLILKPCGLPYFSLDPNPTGQMRSYIKLKKDYMGGMGDDADFAVIGASLDPQQALKSGIAGINWTNFHLGCLINAAEVQRYDSKPVFQLVGTVQQEACIPKPILQSLNVLGISLAKPYTPANAPFDIQVAKYTKIDVIFDTPLVLEVLGSGYDKPSSCGFYMLRHARVKKLHQDRSWKASISFQELQEKAELACNQPQDAESQETRQWYEKLTSRLKVRLERHGSLTPKSKRTVSPNTAGSTFTSVSRHRLSSIAIDSSIAVVSRATDVAKVSTSDAPEPDEYTLVAHALPKAKRSRDATAETPCPPSKKLRAVVADMTNTTHELPLYKTIALSPAMPLGDITNQALGSSVLSSSSGVMGKIALVQDRHQEPSRSKQHPQPQTCRDIPGSRCAFANSVIFLGQCIVNTLYITEDLLPAHGATITRGLNHWDRNCKSHAPMTATVSESQAYIGLRKIVLVEANRVQAVRDLIRQILGLNSGSFRERVEVYDWRVLEDCRRHDLGPEALKGHFLGATIFDVGERRSMFVTTIPDLICEDDVRIVT